MRNGLVAMILALAFSIAPAFAQPAASTVAAPDEVVALPPPLRERLYREILHDNPSAHDRLQRLGAFMFSPEGLGMTYVEAANHTVAQAYEARTANCLTFTMLFLAL
ncbi:MAG TPA: transglutaminase, partial [Lysobacter sp.]